MESNDHDSIIQLTSAVQQLTATLAANNIASVERDTRIETAVKGINGTVRRHDREILEHQAVPHGGVSHVELSTAMSQVAEMWVVWRFGRWLMAGVTLALLAQTFALITIILERA